MMSFALKLGDIVVNRNKDNCLGRVVAYWSFSRRYLIKFSQTASDLYRVCDEDELELITDPTEIALYYLGD